MERAPESTSEGEGAPGTGVSRSSGGKGKGKSLTVSPDHPAIAHNFVGGTREDIYHFRWTISNFEIVRKHDKLIKAQEIVVTTDANFRWKFSLTLWRDLLRHEHVGVYRKLVSSPNGQMEVLNVMDMEVNEKRLLQGKAITMKMNGKGAGYDCAVPRNAKLESLNLVNGALEMSITMKTYFDDSSTVGGKKRKSTEDDFECKSVKKLCNDLASMLEGPKDKISTSELKTEEEDKNVLDSGGFSDVKIISKDGVEFNAHKAILAARNPVFKAMFQSNLLEAQTGVVNIPDVSGTVLKIILNFLYTGTLKKEWKQLELLEEFVQAADKYQLNDCMELVDETIGELCTPETVADLLHLSEKLSLKKAEVDCMVYLRRYCFSQAKCYGDFVKVFGDDK